MGYKIDEIEGVGPVMKEKLAKVRVATTDDLLRLCGDARGRKTVAEQTGVSEKQLLGWCNMADMMRISGIGPQFAELLEAAGVDTVKELQHRNAANLAVKMGEINAQKKLAKTSPAESVVRGWIDQAMTLEPKISH